MLRPSCPGSQERLASSDLGGMGQPNSSPASRKDSVRRKPGAGGPRLLVFSAFAENSEVLASILDTQTAHQLAPALFEHLRPCCL